MGLRLEFEKVSVEDARQVLELPAYSRTAPECARPRTPLPVVAVALDDATAAWLAAIPDALAPRELARRFPRIANDLCALWKRPSRCEVYLRDLMLDRRAGREGFPEDVIRELGALAGHYAELYPTRPVDWGNIGKR